MAAASLALCVWAAPAAAAGAPASAPGSAPAGASPGVDDAMRYIAFVEEPEGVCVSRNAMQMQVRNTHPSRTIRVWLDRYLMGQGTGDRSRSELKPGAAPEPLGCNRNANAVQEWRPVRAVFVD